MAEPGQCQVRRPGPTADGRGRLIDTNRAPGTGQGDRRGQAVRSGPDDDRVGSRRGARGSSRGAAPHPRPVSLRTGAVRVRRADRIGVTTPKCAARLCRVACQNLLFCRLPPSM